MGSDETLGRVDVSASMAHRTGSPPMLERTSTISHGSTPQEVIGDIKELLAILKRGWRMVALSIVICLSLAVIYLAGAKRMYRATARLLVLQQGGRPLNMASNDTSRLME